MIISTDNNISNFQPHMDQQNVRTGNSRAFKVKRNVALTHNTDILYTGDGTETAAVGLLLRCGRMYPGLDLPIPAHEGKYDCQLFDSGNNIQRQKNDAASRRGETSCHVGE